MTFSGSGDIQLETIGDGAFRDCTSLGSFEVPAKVTSIGGRAFKDCTSLKTLTIPGGQGLIIYDQAFQNCGLTSLTIPSRVKTIYEKAFSGCNALTSLTVPAGGITYGLIGYGSDNAFDKCNNLTTVILTGSGMITTNNPVHRDYGGAYQYMTTLIIGDDITSIDTEAFKGCSILTSLTIGNGVKIIGQKAFYGAKLKDVTIPSNVTYIHTEAFYGCVGPFVLNSNPVLDTEAFDKGATVTMNLTANGPVDGYYWTTFYNDYTTSNMQADENTTVYKGTISGSNIALAEVEDKIVNSSTPVILKSTSSHPVLTFTFLPSQDKQGNDLQGTMLTPDTPENCYTLAGKGGKVGFYKYVGSALNPGKAYLIYTGSSRDFLDFGETTEIRLNSLTPDPSPTGEGSEYYDLQGRRVNGTAKKGVYIVNGKKTVIK